MSEDIDDEDMSDPDDHFCDGEYNPRMVRSHVRQCLNVNLSWIENLLSHNPEYHAEVIRMVRAFVADVEAIGGNEHCPTCGAHIDPVKQMVMFDV